MSAEAAELLFSEQAPIMNQLRALGLNDRESQVYVALAESGRVAPAKLARKLTIPRSSVYLILEGLAEKGLVSAHRSKGGMYFTANDSATLLRLIEREFEIVNQKKNAASQVARFVDSLIAVKQKTDGNVTNKIPKLQYFKGKQNVENMLIDNLPRWRASYTNELDSGLWGFQDDSFVTHYKRYLKHRWETAIPGESIHLFTNISDEELKLRDAVPNREVRSLPVPMQFRASVWVYGNYLILIQSREDLHYAYQLEDPVMCSNIRAVFQFLWQMTTII